MPASGARPRFYLEPEGVSGSRVYFASGTAPYPLPLPTYPTIGGTEETMPGDTGPGDGVVFDFGWGPGKVEFTCRGLTLAQKDALDTIYRTWSAGERANVTIGFVDGDSWLCSWAPPGFEPTRRTSRREAYDAKFTLTVLEEN